MSATRPGALAEHSAMVPLPALTLVTGILLGVIAVIGTAGAPESQRSADRAAAGSVGAAATVQPIMDHPGPPSATNSAGAGPASLPLVYYIVASADDAGALLLAVGQTAGERAEPIVMGGDAEYRVLVVETLEEERVAFQEIARAGKRLVSVIDLRGATTAPP